MGCNERQTPSGSFSSDRALAFFFRIERTCLRVFLKKKAKARSLEKELDGVWRQNWRRAPAAAPMFLSSRGLSMNLRTGAQSILAKPMSRRQLSAIQQEATRGSRRNHLERRGARESKSAKFDTETDGDSRQSPWGPRKPAEFLDFWAGFSLEKPMRILLKTHTVSCFRRSGSCF